MYNRVEGIERFADDVRSLVPYANVEFAHGQMDGRTLEDIMYRFNKKEIDVLVCTTIIETGLDIPNANTIIIHDANLFGLAQLYQYAEELVARTEVHLHLCSTGATR